MAIEKSIIRVGGVDTLDPLSGLPMFRQCTTFESNIASEFIDVYYNQWLESPLGNRIEQKIGRKYVVVDQPAVTHIVPGDPNADPPTEDQVIEDIPAYPMFTGWYAKSVKQEWVGAQLGHDIIMGAINATLEGMRHNVPDGHKVIPG